MSLSHVVDEIEKDHAIAVLKTSNIMNFCQESAPLINDEVVVNWTASGKTRASKYAATVLRYGGKFISFKRC